MTLPFDERDIDKISGHVMATIDAKRRHDIPGIEREVNAVIDMDPPALFAFCWCLGATARRLRGHDPTRLAQPAFVDAATGRVVPVEEFPTDVPHGRGVLAATRFAVAAINDDKPTAMALFQTVGNDGPEAQSAFLTAMVDVGTMFDSMVRAELAGDN